eukprot:Skav230404  [mRNA]  locus=scaffold4006:4348:7710:+ [translate_table: standard]
MLHEYLQKFLQKRQQAQEEKEKKEAVEDDWLFDDKDKKEAAAPDDNDSEDDFAFRMLLFLPSEMEKAPPKPVNKELKAEQALSKLETVTANKGFWGPGLAIGVQVVNLIDWGECDVADETEDCVLHSRKSVLKHQCDGSVMLVGVIEPDRILRIPEEAQWDELGHLGKRQRRRFHT